MNWWHGSSFLTWMFSFPLLFFSPLGFVMPASSILTSSPETPQCNCSWAGPLSAEQQCCLQENGCLYCGKTGHFVSSCPLRSEDSPTEPEEILPHTEYPALSAVLLTTFLSQLVSALRSSSRDTPLVLPVTLLWDALWPLVDPSGAGDQRLCSCLIFLHKNSHQADTRLLQPPSVPPRTLLLAHAPLVHCYGLSMHRTHSRVLLPANPIPVPP